MDEDAEVANSLHREFPAQVFQGEEMLEKNLPIFAPKEIKLQPQPPNLITFLIPFIDSSHGWTGFPHFHSFHAFFFSL